jgi:hypothetical protein
MVKGTSRGVLRESVVLILAGAVALANGCVSRSAVSSASGAAAEEDGGSPGSGDPIPNGGGGTAIGPVIDGGFPCPPQAPIPDFGTAVTCSTPPPPISGGTLIVTRDGTKAVAADPDRDAIYVVDLASKALLFTIALQPGDEPGRLAEDGAGRVHVALRGSGVLATIDPIAGTVTQRRAVCPAPRGVAWQSSSDVVWVACATGELASLPAAGGAATSEHIDRDLRDVIVTGNSLAVTQFRSAQILRLDDEKTVSRTDAPPAPGPIFEPHVAWRAVAGPSGSIVLAHQAESTQSVSTKSSGGYGCSGGLGNFPPPPPDFGGSDSGAPVFPELPILGGGIVESALTVVGSDGSIASSMTFSGVLPIDVAVSPDGTRYAAVSAGSGAGAAAIDNVFLFTTNASDGTLRIGNGPATSIAFVTNTEVLVQTREPAALWIASLPGEPSDDAGVADDAGDAASAAPVSMASIALSSTSRYDTGHDIFHMHAGSLVACASCHPEGGDDGHVWLLDGEKRRTPSLRGTIAGTAPYHWPGDEKDFDAIVQDVYVGRMSGGSLTAPQSGALSAWVNSIPAPPAPTWVDPAAAAAGRALFQSTTVGCATCHSGSKLTNNATVDVGTGGAFQVPPLVGVGWRTPLLHDGCAATIGDRFGTCATSAHGNIGALSAQDITNLTAYLETL